MSERPRLLPPLVSGRAVPAYTAMLHLRLMLVAFGLCLWSMVIGVQLLRLQVVGRAGYARQAARQSERTLTLDSRRGPIVDRNGHQLALSVDIDSVYADPQAIVNPHRAATELAKVLRLDSSGRRELLAQLQRNRSFVWVKRKVDSQTANAVRELQIEGIGFVTENRRYYPKRELAAHVLGFVGLENKGMSGIEYAYEKAISGRSAKVVVRADAKRRLVGFTERPSTDGHTVVLTIDEAIQHAAERELDRAMRETQSIAGLVVAMDPRTGEILAMANRPTFNPNRFRFYPSSHWRNRAVADAYEPGSIFKIFTAAAGLAEKVVDPDEVIDCGNGFVEIAGVRINDHHVFDQLTFRDVMAKSSDVGVVRVAQRLGKDNFNRYVRDFGFGAPTGVSLPAESSGLFRPTSRWSALSLASLSFGQEVGVTAIQMTAAIAAVANGGLLMKPLIVKRVEDSQGHLIESFPPSVVRRVLPPETVDTLTDVLENVVLSGTGHRAAVSGYSVAGKTGTAQKIDMHGRYSMIDHVASFVGFAPARSPAIVILVSLDTPRGERNQGGDVAAPVFSRLAQFALQQMGAPPDDATRVLHVKSQRATDVLPARYAMGSIKPAPATMPDLFGLSAREAAFLAAQRGLQVRLVGSGVVLTQSLEPGSETLPGMTCVLGLGARPRREGFS